jgi:hypothetical protein
MIIEDELTTEQVTTIHEFGDCWIKGYDKWNRAMWEKALWLWAWDKKVVWSKDRWNVPVGISSANVGHHLQPESEAKGC